MDSLIAIANLQLQFDEAVRLAHQKAIYSLTVATTGVDMAWDAYLKEARIETSKANTIGPVDGLFKARDIYRVTLADFLKRYPDESRSITRKYLLSESLSDLALRGYGDYKEANTLLGEYIEKSKPVCQNCAVYGITQLLSNTSSELFRTRNKSVANLAISYMHYVDSLDIGKIDKVYLPRLFDAYADVYRMLGEIDRNAQEFAKAESYARRAIASAKEEGDIAYFNITLGEIYRQRGEYLQSEADSERAITIYEGLIPSLTKFHYYAQRDELYKRIGAVEYGLAIGRSDCEMLKRSSESLANALKGITERDNPGEYSGLIQMRDRNIGLMPKICHY
jgi:tetratricopeptide (TPR) repeat protein